MAKKARKFDRIKAALVIRGLNISKWARKRGYPVTTVHQAASGARAGSKSKRILIELEEMINVENESS